MGFPCDVNDIPIDLKKQMIYGVVTKGSKLEFYFSVINKNKRNYTNIMKKVLKKDILQ